MEQKYTEEMKQKYCRGFKKCTLPITDYAEKMNIPVEELKQWLKDYKEPLPYGAINLSELMPTPKVATNKVAVKFETETIKIEVKENHDRDMLKKVLDLLVVMCNVK